MTHYTEILDNALRTLRYASTDAYDRGWHNGWRAGYKQGGHGTETATQPNKTRNSLAMGLYERLQEMGDRHNDQETTEIRLEWWQLGWDAAIAELTNHLDKETEGEHLTLTITD